MKFMDIITEVAEEERKYFENYREYAELIKKISVEILGNADVYVFGSIVEGKHTPASDIDILIVSENMPEKGEERAKIRGKILRSIDVFAPFEIHLANLREFEWYNRFISSKVKI